MEFRYNQLERILSTDFANSGDTPENSVSCKQALDLCLTDFCRNNLRQRIARSRFSRLGVIAVVEDNKTM